MAYSHPNLFRLGPANSDAPTVWVYSSADSQATVNTSGYFDAASADLNVGDIIIAHLGGAGAVFIFPVLSNSGGVVDVADGLAIGVTDTD